MEIQGQFHNPAGQFPNPSPSPNPNPSQAAATSRSLTLRAEVLRGSAECAAALETAAGLPARLWGSAAVMQGELQALGDMRRYGEIWGDAGRCGETWGDIG